MKYAQRVICIFGAIFVIGILDLISAASPQSAPGPSGSSELASPEPQFDSGNDPTIVRKRFSFRNEYIRFDNGLGVNITTLQAAFPILQEKSCKLNFGFDMPLTYYEVEQPISAALSGVGDMKAQLMAIKPFGEQTTLLFGSNLWLPTAEQQLLELPNIGDYTDVDLGTGKFRLEPLLGAVYFISPKLFVVPLYAHDMSFAGKPQSPTINRGTARFFVNRTLEKGWYVSSETQFLINYAHNNDLDTFQKFELGKAFSNGTVFYLKPGVGIAPDEFNREWAIETGIRFVF